MPKPFVSHDGADAHGVRAEVLVQVGTGTVLTIEGREEQGRNVQVHIQSDNDQVRKPIKGWLGKNDPLLAKVIEAHEQGRVVEYRVETQRKPSIDRTKPIDELRGVTTPGGRASMDVTRENCINIFAALDGERSKEAVTNPAEDPHAGGRIPASDAPPPAAAPAPAAGAGLSAEAALAGLASARRAGFPESVVDSAIALALAAGATAKQVMAAGVSTDSKATRPEPRTAYATEATPFTQYNTDGRANLGSYAVSAALACERFAFDRLVEFAQARNEDAVAADISLGQALGMGKLLLTLADRVQVGAYGGGKPNRMAKSHTIARSLVFDSVRHRNPIPFEQGQDAKVRDAWMDAVVSEAVERFQALGAVALDVPAVPAAPVQDTPADTKPQTKTSDEPAAEPPASEQPPVEATPEPEQAPVQAEQAAPEQTTLPVQPAADTATEAAKATAKFPVEGDEDFQAPSDEQRRRFAALAGAAGFEAAPNSPVAQWLVAKFGQAAIRKVHGPALEQLLGFYESKGDRAGELFKQHVLRETSGSQRPAA